MCIEQAKTLYAKMEKLNALVQQNNTKMFNFDCLTLMFNKGRHKRT